ncbi:hypothetical protein, partial [Roseinatronobacter sp.]|uniref:hypothetical protein n=1 Tax=Roseinatronobacter sp. TaxID=1945755 RepID=UPI0025E4F1A7
MSAASSRGAWKELSFNWSPKAKRKNHVSVLIDTLRLAGQVGFAAFRTLTKKAVGYHFPVISLSDMCTAHFTIARRREGTADRIGKVFVQCAKERRTHQPRA